MLLTVHTSCSIIPLILFCLSSSIALATCVVITRTDAQIMVGADSRRLIVSSTGTVKGFEDTNCKIRKAGSFYYTLVGANDRLQIGHAEHKASLNLPFEETVNMYAEDLRNDYNRYLDDIRRNDINSYIKRRFMPGLYFTEMALFAIVNNVPEVRILRFWNNNPPNFPPNVGYTITRNPAIEVLGTSLDFINQTSEQRNKLIKESIIDPIIVIQNIIQEQSVKWPNFVGGVTDILQLNNEGQVWVARKPNCVD